LKQEAGNQLFVNKESRKAGREMVAFWKCEMVAYFGGKCCGEGVWQGNERQRNKDIDAFRRGVDGLHLFVLTARLWRRSCHG
jgi:hypothetical protein